MKPLTIATALLTLLLPLPAVAQAPACAGDEIPFTHVTSFQTPELHPFGTEALVFHDEKSFCGFLGQDAPCDTLGIDFRAEVALAAYLPQMTSCDGREVKALCDERGRTRVVVGWERRIPCMLPAFVDPAWLVIKTDKPLGGTCTEYRWETTLNNTPANTLQFGCGILMSFLRAEAPGSPSLSVTVYEDGGLRCAEAVGFTSYSGLLRGSDLGEVHAVAGRTCNDLRDETIYPAGGPAGPVYALGTRCGFAFFEADSPDLPEALAEAGAFMDWLVQEVCP